MTMINFYGYSMFSGEQDKGPSDKKPPNIEIIIQSYYICFILMVILKDIKELIQKIKYFNKIFFHILFIVHF